MSSSFLALANLLQTFQRHRGDPLLPDGLASKLPLPPTASLQPEEGNIFFPPLLHPASPPWISQVTHKPLSHFPPHSEQAGAQEQSMRRDSVWSILPSTAGSPGQDLGRAHIVTVDRLSPRNQQPQYRIPFRANTAESCLLPPMRETVQCTQ